MWPSLTTVPSRLSLGAAVAEFHPTIRAAVSGLCARCARGASAVALTMIARREPCLHRNRLLGAMAEKATKGKPKAKREKPSVLGNLPATRPQRLGRPRTDTPAVSEEPAASPARTKRETPRRKPAVGPAKVQASAAPSASTPTAAKPAPAKPEPSPATAAESKPAPARRHPPAPAHRFS